jgi:hypothetical protein
MTTPTSQPTSPATTGRGALLLALAKQAHQLLEATMADVTQAQADYVPAGIANPLGATYAHVIWSEDAVVQGMLQGSAPLSASSWAGRTGLSEPMPSPGPEWAGYADWTRRVKIDLPALRQYAQAVEAATEAWIASLSEADLDRPIDMSFIGLGEQPLASAIGILVMNHLGTETGEISVLKGLQGARGYPF